MTTATPERTVHPDTKKVMRLELALMIAEARIRVLEAALFEATK